MLDIVGLSCLQRAVNQWLGAKGSVQVVIVEAGDTGEVCISCPVLQG